MIVNCSCCGRGLQDNEEENVSFGEVPYPHDTGFGMCRSCGGDPKAKGMREQLGWAMITILEARFDVIRKALKPKNRTKWDRFPYEKKCLVTMRYMEKGLIF